MAFPIAVVQLDVDFADPRGNLGAALSLAREAVARGAKLILFPEACITDIYRGAEKNAEPIPGPTTEAFAAIAGESVIALPLLERAQNNVFSSCALIGANGVLGIARKSHLQYDASGLELFRDEELVRAGNELTVVELEGIRIGIALGFDADFPETFRSLALKGADVILAALNCAEPDIPFLRAMARRNCVPVAVANRTGFKRIYPSAPEFSAASTPIVQDKRGEFMVRCKGGSAIIGPDGKIEARPRAHLSESADNAAIPERVKIPANHFQEEEILMASFIIEDIRVQRMTSQFLAARRPDLYR